MTSADKSHADVNDQNPQTPDPVNRSRRYLLGALPVVALAAAACSDNKDQSASEDRPTEKQDPGPPPRPATGDEAIAVLMEGNTRFVDNKPQVRDTADIKEIWTSISTGQEPFATVLTCADSRLGPELIFDQFVGDVFGAPLAMEGLLAFFLESTFLGLWIFGWDKLPRKVHAACMWAVHIGTLGKLGGAVLLGRFAHEAGGQARHPGQRGDHRDAAHFQTGEHFNALGHQRGHRLGHLGEQHRVGLEAVLVEVLLRHPPGAKRELPGEVRGGVDAVGQVGSDGVVGDRHG